MSGTIVVSNRGPLTFRTGPDGALVPVPAGGGLASSLHRILAGSGTTWASVTMGAADREAVAQGLMHDDGLDLVPGRASTTTPTGWPTTSSPTRPCGTATTTSSTCPTGPASTGTGGRPGRATGPTTGPWPTPWRRGRPRATPCWCRTTTSPCWAGCWPSAAPTCARCTSCTPPSPTPAMLGVLPDDVAAELLDGMAGYGGLRLPLPQVGGRVHRLLRGGRAGAAPGDVRRPARARRRRARGGGGRARRARRRPTRCGPRWAGAASSPGPTAWSPRRTSCAGCWPSRSCWSPTRSGAARWCTWPSPIPAGRGWPSISPTGPTWSTRRERINHALGAPAERVDADPALGARRLGPLARRARPCPTSCWSTRCATGSTWWPRRARCSTRPTACSCSPARPAPGRSWRSRARRAGGQPLRRVGDGRRAACRALTMGDARAGRRAAGRCGRAVRGRTSADWWADQLAAAVAPRAEPLRAGVREADAASASARSSATAPAAPGTVRSACVGHLGGALGVDRGDAHRVERAAVGRRPARRARRRPAGRRCRRRTRRRCAQVLAPRARPPAPAPPSPCRPASGGRSSRS